METYIFGQLQSEDSSISDESGNFPYRCQLSEWVRKETLNIQKVDLEMHEIIPEKDEKQYTNLNLNKNKMLIKRKLLNHHQTAGSESDSDSNQLSDDGDDDDDEERPTSIRKISRLKKRPTQLYEEIYCFGEVCIQCLYLYYQIDQLFHKLSKRKINNYFSQQITTRNSSLNYELNQKKNKKKIFVVEIIYFGKDELKKEISISRDMKAAELICKAVKLYKREPNFDQNLLEFPNMPLVHLFTITEFQQVYQLRSKNKYAIDNPEITKTFGYRQPIRKSRNLSRDQLLSDDEDEIKSKQESSSDEEDECDEFEYGLEIMNIDLESDITYRKVYLEVNDKFMKLNLDDLRKFKNSKIMLLLVDDMQLKRTFILYIHEKRHLELCFSEIRKQMISEKVVNQTYIQEINPTNFYFRSKYSNMNFQNEEINLKILLYQLPIPWVQLVARNRVSLQPSLSFPHQEVDPSLISQSYITEINFDQKSMFSSFGESKFKSEVLDKNEYQKQLINHYNYEEFEMIRLDESDGKDKDIVMVGIDFFDLTVTTLKNLQVRRRYNLAKKLNSWFSKIIYYLIEDEEVNDKNVCKVPISNISEIKEERGILNIIYSKMENRSKTISLKVEVHEQDKKKEKNNQQLYHIYQKLNFLIEQKQIYSRILLTS